MRFLLLLCVSMIFAIGLIMIFSTTSADILDQGLGLNTHQALLKQISYACIGLLLGAGVYLIGYRKILELSPYLLGIFTLLLLIVLIPGVGREVNGSRRWIGIAGFSFQPSEFVKYIVPAFFIQRFLPFEGKSIDLKSFIQVVVIACIPILLILVEPNNGTAAVICSSLVVLCLLMQIPFKYWAWPLCGLLIVGGVFAYQLPYVSARLKVYLHPELDLKGKGHQPYQAKIAAGSGGLLGKGPGNSWQKLSYLPEAQNDYIAAIYAEEFGFLGIGLLIALYMSLATIGFIIACYTPDRAGSYLAGVITFLITFQAFLNLGVVSGLLPSTGLNLPLFSQGGTSLMANIVGIALLFNIECKKLSTNIHKV